MESKCYGLENLDASEYHARPEWSQSQAKLLPGDPESFYGYHVAKRWTFEATDDMELGTQLHAIHLERKPLLVIPPDALTSNGQRRGGAWRQWCLDHPTNPGVLERDAGRIRSMSAAFDNEPKIAAMFEAIHQRGQVEYSIFRRDPETGLELRCRLDGMAENAATHGILIGDIKATCIDTDSEREVGQKVFAMKYHQQAAWYIDAVKELTGERRVEFALAFVRNRPPFTARLWVAPAEVVELGRRRNRAALADLRRRLDSGDWNGRGHGKINYIILPKYAFSDTASDAPAFSYDEFTPFETGDD